jgi:hypothetical protein
MSVTDALPVADMIVLQLIASKGQSREAYVCNGITI